MADSFIIYILIFFEISAFSLQLLFDHVGISNSLDHVSVHSVWDGMCTNHSGTNTFVKSKHDDTIWYPSCFTHRHHRLWKIFGACWTKHRKWLSGGPRRFPYMSMLMSKFPSYFNIYDQLRPWPKCWFSTTAKKNYEYICMCQPCPYAQSLANATLALRLLHLQDLLQLRAPAMTNPRRCTDHVTHRGCAILLSRARTFEIV